MGLTKRAAIHHLWTFYRGLPLSWRAHQLVRTMLFPFSLLLDAVQPPGAPSAPGSILDLGCGHGLFLALAKFRYPDLDLVGMDLSPEKIAVAREAFAAAGIPVRDLVVRDIREFDEHSVDVITIDVMYLVPIARWDDILVACRRCLRPGGRLLLKEMDPALAWKFAILRFEEWLAVRVLGWTLGSKFSFPSSGEIRQTLERAGFRVEQIAVDAGYHVPHCLWIGTVENQDASGGDVRKVPGHGVGTSG